MLVAPQIEQVAVRALGPILDKQCRSLPPVPAFPCAPIPNSAADVPASPELW